MAIAGNNKTRRCMDLQQAIVLNDLEKLTEIVKDEAIDLDCAVRGTTPLSLAISAGRPLMVDVLVRRGADVNKMSRDRNDRWEPPLFTACRLGMEDVAGRLLEASADVDATDFYHHTPLWVATKEQRPRLVHLLLNHGATLNVNWSWNECPLYLATKYLKYKGRRRMAELLLRNGIGVNATDESGRTPLYWTLTNGDKEFSRMLVQCGARIGRVSWNALDERLSDDLKRDVPFYEWLNDQMTSPLPLQRICLRSIRSHLASIRGGSILESVARLPLPYFLIRYISLETF